MVQEILKSLRGYLEELKIMNDLAILYDRGNQQRARELDRLCEQKWEVTEIKHNFAWKRYLLYLVRWGVLAIPGAWFLEMIQQVIPGLYIPNIIGQILTGAWVYFIDRWIFKGDK